jgi:hypothetical protein
MDFNLEIIGWEAIGAIATFVMAIAAFVTIYISIKQNNNSQKFQIRLIRQQQAQQRLDDMVENVLKIANNINPFHILHYSNKLTANTFTENDRQALEKLAVDDDLCNTNLTLQILKLGNYASAKPLLDHLHKIRADYGLWSRTVNTLFQYLCFSEESEQTLDIVELMVIEMINEMTIKLHEINSPYKQDATATAQQHEGKPIEKALSILKIFEAEIAKYILSQKRNFENELIQFVKSEQLKIDDIITQ